MKRKLIIRPLFPLKNAVVVSNTILTKYLLSARDILTIVADGIKDSESLRVAEYLAIVADRYGIE